MKYHTIEEFAQFVSEELAKRNVQAILVGGACVSIYSNNRYQSYDLNYVTFEDMKKVRKALLDIGFSETNRYFQYPDCEWFVEFVTPPVAVGRQYIQNFHTQGAICMLRPEDSVKDRLASYFHWDDIQGLNQAISIIQEHPINLDEIETWAKAEDFPAKYEIFIKEIQNHLKTTEKR